MSQSMLRCDLHVHSVHSGRVNLPLLRHFANDSYSEPLAVYEAARRRGMDLVTLTDHDTIDGALRIAHLPGTFLSEEISCVLPGGRQLHVNAFGIDERQHARIERLRLDPPALFAYLREEGIAACVNHLFSRVTGPRELGDIVLALASVGLVEVRNGMMPEAINAWAEEASRVHRLGAVAGSDGHSLPSVARAWTEVPGAATCEDFLAGLRSGLGLPAGRHGRYLRTTADVLRNFAGGYRELTPRAFTHPAAFARLTALLLATLALPLAPAVTAALQVRDLLFTERFGSAWRATVRPRKDDGMGSGLELTHARQDLTPSHR